MLPKKRTEHWTADVYAHPDDERIVVDAAGIDLSRQGTVRQARLSATAVPARDLRGIDVGVKKDARELETRFPNRSPESDFRYSVAMQPSWPTLDWVVDRADRKFGSSGFCVGPIGARTDADCGLDRGSLWSVQCLDARSNALCATP
ncbi:MAG: hypothetical protein QF890_03220, partial [Myxococcota bacterium]|nr:hypothetical protein [Myxococcota bacterium]MDP7300446.1 hypothetical protein [Myxococcota bacterium]MDP7431565.1 hypothetical protein [Myxococcota bacterium]